MRSTSVFGSACSTSVFGGVCSTRCVRPCVFVTSVGVQFNKTSACVLLLGDFQAALQHVRPSAVREVALEVWGGEGR